MEHSIYCIENLINGKMYIGYTTKGEKRWKIHLAVANGKNLNSPSYSYIHKAINSYGKTNFSFSIFEIYQDELSAKSAEVYWIAYLKQQNIRLYNLTDGGDGIVGYQYSIEQLKHQSDIMKGKFVGKLNPFYGKTHTEESKKKISKTRIKNLGSSNYIGEKSSQSKLKDSDVLSIVSQYKNGFSQDNLSKLFNVSRRTIQSILNGYTWSNLTNIKSSICRSLKTGINNSFNKTKGEIEIINKTCENCHLNFKIQIRSLANSGYFHQTGRKCSRGVRFCNKECKNNALKTWTI